MIITVEEVRKQFKGRTEDEIEIIWMYLNADAELRSVMKHTLKRVIENPHCIDFADNWQGSADDLRTALAQI